MAKLILNPAYEVRKGEPDCNHKRERFIVGMKIYEFCDECRIVWVKDLARRTD